MGVASGEGVESEKAPVHEMPPLQAEHSVV